MSIDKAKGIVCKPMPKEWHDKFSIVKMGDENKKEFYFKIVADKKPYFMRYIYPTLMKEYNSYMKKANRNSLREFQLEIDELMQLPLGQTTERQREFIKYHNSRMPVGTNDCLMNKICKRFEKEFDNCIKAVSSSGEFDYTILRSEATYTSHQYYDIIKLYDEYNRKLQNYEIYAMYERIDKSTANSMLLEMNRTFRQECDKICPNQYSLCNIIVDMCYTKTKTKKFAWNVCASEIIHNLLYKNNNTISYPTLAEDGDIEYCGHRFRVETKQIESEETIWL